MNEIFDLFGFASVLLHATALVARSVLVGSFAFLVLIARPLVYRASVGNEVLASTLRAARIAAWTLCGATVVGTVLNGLVLTASLQIGIAEIAGARFALAGLVQALGAAAAALSSRANLARPQSPLFAVAVSVVFAAALATTHSTARPVFEPSLIVATALHQLGAALWLGGLPCFYRALHYVENDSGSREWVGRRYSAVSIAGVALIVLAAALLTVAFIGSWRALYGTPYGAMAATKGAMLALLLLVGSANFFAVRRFTRSVEDVARVRRFVEVEMALALGVLALAASMTSAPPAIDLRDDGVTWSELVARMAPAKPRLDTPEASSLAIATLQRKLDEEAARSGAEERPRAFIPGAGEMPPRNAHDIAWSEYNHHWAGVIVLVIGVVALIERSGVAPWARHWPLLFFGLAAFILLRSDPEVWPLGEIGLFESLRDPEVVQHRVFAVMTAAFATFEWRVRTGRFRSPVPAFVFPALMAAGGVLLLAHTHALSAVKEQVLVEWSHLPLGVLGIVGGASRWLQLRSPAGEARWAGWLWPACLVATGLVLLNYREA